MPPLLGTFAYPTPLSTKARFIAPTQGTIYLKVNDSPAELSDNQGGFTATIRLAK